MDSKDWIYPAPLLVEALYWEARASIVRESPAPIVTVMLCSKLLSRVAVDLGAKENQSLSFYIEWFMTAHYIRYWREWLSYIELEVDSSSHEIKPATVSEAARVFKLTDLILRNIYELPTLVPYWHKPEEWTKKEDIKEEPNEW